MVTRIICRGAVLAFNPFPTSPLDKSIYDVTSEDNIDEFDPNKSGWERLKDLFKPQ